MEGDFRAVHGRHDEEVRQQASIEVHEAGTQYVVAAYSNGQSGAVVLLGKSGEGDLTPIQLIRDHLVGSEPAVTAIDVDGDGAPEVEVDFNLDKGGAETWIYKITGHQLTLISPTNKFGGSMLTWPTLVDLGGKGIVDIINHDNVGSRRKPVARYSHYVLRNSAYVAAEPLDFYEVFYGGRNVQKPQTSVFSIPASSIGNPFYLTVINGGGIEKFKVPRVAVTLNGVEVSSASDDSRHRGAWTIPVSLQQQNTIRVKLCAGSNQHSDDDGGGDNQQCGERGRIAIAIHNDGPQR
jgi:hypothetical protein